MLRLTLAAAALALASAGDQFCFDHSGAPTGRAITAGQSAAILPGRALNEIFPGGLRIVPQPSTLEENNGDGKVPSACYEAGKIPVKAPYNLKLGQCRGDLSGEELLEVCLALCPPSAQIKFRGASLHGVVPRSQPPHCLICAQVLARRGLRRGAPPQIRE